MPMAKQRTFKRTVFTTIDYWLRLRVNWIAADDQERRHFLAGLFPELPDERIVEASRLTEEETHRHYRYRSQDAAQPQTPLAYLRRYWRQVAPEERLRFLCDMLTPNERRALQLGFEDDDAG
jgi:hypothetical protein